MMPVLVEPSGSGYRASVYGAPAVAADAPTRDEAIAALQVELGRRTRQGELVWLDVPKVGVTDLARAFEADQHMDELVAEIYRQRDAEKAALFPE